MAKFFVALHNESVARQSSYVARQMFFCRKHCRMVLRRLFLRIKVKVSVYLILRVSLTACNICQRAILQNIAHLHHIDLYGNIF